MKTHLVLLFSLLFCSLSAYAIESAQLERIHWEKEITKPTTLVFKNRYGNIRLRSTDDQKLVFHGVAQHSENHRIQLDFDEKTDQIIAQVLFKNSEHLPESHRLDAVIIVPSLLKLEIEIEGGELSSKGLKSEVKARSINSNMSIKSSKNVDLFSQNGDVSFYAKSSKANTQHQLKSHKGDVNIYVNTASDNGFTTTAGTEISTNDAELLLSKTTKGRQVLLGNNQAKNLFEVQTDTGFIRIIKQKHQ